MATPRDDVFTSEGMNRDKFAVVFDTNCYLKLIRETAIEDIEATIAQIKEKKTVRILWRKPLLRLLRICLLVGGFHKAYLNARQYFTSILKKCFRLNFSPKTPFSRSNFVRKVMQNRSFITWENSFFTH
jgi:hypothetical protein